MQIYDLIFSGDPATWLFILGLSGFVCLSTLLLSRYTVKRNPPTKEELQKDFLRRSKELFKQSENVADVRLKLEALGVAFETLYGFNPWKVIPPPT